MSDNNKRAECRQPFLLETGGLRLALSMDNGRTGGLQVITEGKDHLWSAETGDVTVRDDVLRRTFDNRDLYGVNITQDNGAIKIVKKFNGAPWTLIESYSTDGDDIRWNFKVDMPKGSFRSIAVTWQLPWPAHPYPWQLWAARHDMPMALYENASLWMEYGEATAGAMIPAVALYHPSERWGLALCKPLDLPTPRFRVGCGFRDPGLRVRFDWLALPEGGQATGTLLMRGIPGCWRPALGWVYEKFPEYFHGRSERLPKLWGGCTADNLDRNEEDVVVAAKYGATWCEVQPYYPLYGQYDAQAGEWLSIRLAWHTPPEDGSDLWQRPQLTPQECRLTVQAVCDRLSMYNRHGIAPLLYVQVCGDASPEVAKRFPEDEIRDRHGKRVEWVEMGVSRLVQMNAADELEFGRHLDHTLEGVLKKFTGHGGVFVDQACYNFVDTAHHDGLSAIDNRPVYLTGFNYVPRLKRLSATLHPAGLILANGPGGIEIMECIDGVMAESLPWLCRRLKYICLAKPLYFYMQADAQKTEKADEHRHTNARVEAMLQNCLIYGAGYTAAAWSAAYADLYNAYLPLIKRMADRRWVFDPDPVTLPEGWEGDIFRAADGALLVSLVRRACSIDESRYVAQYVTVRTRDAHAIRRAKILSAGKAGSENVDFSFDKYGLKVGPLPQGLKAGLLILDKEHQP